MSLAASLMLVSTGWLAAQLGSEAPVILHVGSQQDYEKGHIPGARLVTLADISMTGAGGLRLELPPVPALEAAFGRLGVGDNARVVVYAGTDSVQSATRVWFTLDYLGAGERASLLDGGLAAWQAEGRPLSTEAPRVEPRQFTAHARPEVVVDAAWVRDHLGGSQVALVDARTPEYYTTAHIPGARNVPFSSLLESDRKMKSAAVLGESLGPPGKPVASYCHIGQQATVVYFVARYLGRDARLYDGSFQDWSSRKELPVESEKK
jgi:thiosulfate/3-mercaptopyruvate sulfurtransferase